MELTTTRRNLIAEELIDALASALKAADAETVSDFLEQYDTTKQVSERDLLRFFMGESFHNFASSLIDEEEEDIWELGWVDSDED